MTTKYSVVAELWTMFETSALVVGKRLSDDIAKRQKADPKELWNKIKKQIQLGLVDIELPEPLSIVCSHPSGTSEGGAIRLRCRAPCIIGFDACPRHIGIPYPTLTSTTYESVDRIIDCTGHTYFVDSKGIARDKNGKPRGYIQDSVLNIFEITNKISV